MVDVNRLVKAASVYHVIIPERHVPDNVTLCPTQMVGEITVGAFGFSSISIFIVLVQPRASTTSAV